MTYSAAFRKLLLHTSISMFFLLCQYASFSQCLSGDCNNGNGKYDYGYAVYDGSFKNGKPHGKGVMDYGAGEKYEGMFVNGKEEGDGIMYKKGVGKPVNFRDGIMMVKKEAAIDLEIVGGQREANIIYASHIELSLERKKNYLYIDVGGGSTELSVFSDGELIASRSFNLGGIRILDNQDKAETWAEMKGWVRSNVHHYKNLSGIGTGGNINKLFRMADGKDNDPITFAKLQSLYTYLNSFSLKDRINVLGLNSDRADVIIPAAEIYLTVMKWAGVKQIYVPRVGLVDGVIQLLIEKNFNT